MHMVLEVEEPTRESWEGGSKTRLDNVFCSSKHIGRVIKCGVFSEDTPPATDHYPIRLEIDLDKREAREEKRRNFKKVD